MTVEHPNRRSHHNRALTKDLILKDYLPKYFSGLKKRGCKKIIYLDAFAGPGRYEDESEGSPLHVLRLADGLKEIKSDPYFRENLIFIFVESDPQIFEYLQKSVAPYLEKGFKIACLKADGSNAVKQILSYIRKKVADLYQIGIFVYLDPWGLIGIDREIILDILSLRQFLSPSEVLLRFPPYLVCRYYKNSKVGPDWIKRRLGLSSEELEEVVSEPEKTERHEAILRAYATTIMEDHFNSNGNLLSGCAVETVGSGFSYYMLFFSESDAGVSHMSDSMAKSFIRRRIEMEIEEISLLKDQLKQEFFSKNGKFLYKKAVKNRGQKWPRYFYLSPKELASFKEIAKTREQLLFHLLRKRVFAISHYSIKEALEALGGKLEGRGLYRTITWPQP